MPRNINIVWSNIRSKCPQCGSSDGRADIISYDGQNVENQGYYKCFSCGEIRTPRTFYQQTITSKLDQKIKNGYENTVRQLNNNLLNLIISKFGDVENTLKTHPIGTDALGNTVFWYSNKNGVYKCKSLSYNKEGKRLKKGASKLPKGVDAVFGYAVNDDFFTYFKKDDFPEPCAFGFSSIKNDKQIVIVESEKSAFLASMFYPDYYFISFGGSNGLTKFNEKLLVNASEMPIAILYDADDSGLEASKKITQASNSIAYTNLTPAFYERFKDKEKGYDIADYILDGNIDKNLIESLSNSEETEEADFQTTPIGKIHIQLNKQLDLRRNTLTQLVESKKKGDKKYEVIEEEQLNTFWVNAKLKKINLTKREIASYFGSSLIPSYDPFKEYCDSLPVFNPKSRKDKPIHKLARLVKVANNEEDLFVSYLKHWLCGFYRQALGIGTNPYLLVFYGEQQIGKSQFARRIIPEKLRNFTANSSLADIDKDTKMEACRNYLIELDELDYISKASELQIKQFLTTDKFMVRAPYDVFEKKYKRHASFIGSSNVDCILQDPTGSRRFLIIEALDIDYEKIDETLMKEVFSQVKYMVEELNFDHYFNKEDTININNSNEKYRNVPFIEIAISKHFTPSEYSAGTTLNDIKYYLLEREPRIKEFELSKISAILKKLGYSNKQIKIDGKNQRFYNIKLQNRYMQNLG